MIRCDHWETCSDKGCPHYEEHEEDRGFKCTERGPCIVHTLGVHVDVGCVEVNGVHVY